MDIDEFWQIVAQARDDAGATRGRFDSHALAEALTDRLAALPVDQILDFDERFDEVRHRLEQWELCAACLLISGYISDDTFTDFKAGVVALGREAYDRAAQDADSLAEHPVVIDIARGRVERTELNAEEFGTAPSTAFTRLNDGDDEAFWEAMQPRWDARGPQSAPGAWDGRFGAPGDRDLIAVRVPRLVALFGIPVRSR